MPAGQVTASELLTWPESSAQTLGAWHIPLVGKASCWKLYRKDWGKNTFLVAGHLAYRPRDVVRSGHSGKSKQLMEMQGG